MISIVGLDFIDATGVRSFSFQLCRRDQRGLETVAIVDWYGDKVSRLLCIRALDASHKALIRLSRTYRNRSVPQIFNR